MPKNIEMNILDNGNYDVLYPASKSEIIYNSEHLKDLWNLSDGSDIDDAFDYIEKKLILLQYNKAGINVTLKTIGGNPLEGIPIKGITANYDGTGSCVTDSSGQCFGYCDAGSVTVSCNTYVDMTINSQQVQTLATEMYDVELTATNLLNFKKWTSTTNNIRFSNNVSRVDVSCGGAGGGAGGISVGTSGGLASGSGGGGGYTAIQEQVSFLPETNYQVVVGAGGKSGASGEGYGSNGGNSIFLNVTATGGKGGSPSNGNEEIAGTGGEGNGKGANGAVQTLRYDIVGSVGGVGTQYIYSSFDSEQLYGGGGGSGSTCHYNSYENNFPVEGGDGGSPGGGKGGGTADWTYRGQADMIDATDGINGLGGGGGGGGVAMGQYSGREDPRISYCGNGGSGCVAIRMHLKSS